MASAIARIGNALRYDASESILAAGGSLADAFAIAIQASESIALDADVSPESFAYTIPARDLATIAPGKLAA